MVIQPASSARDTLAKDVKAALARAGAPRGPLSRSFKAVQRKLTFRSGAKPADLYSALKILCVYGHYRDAVTVSGMLRNVDPDSWEVDYNHIRAAIHVSYFFARRAGDDGAANELSDLITVPAGYSPAPSLMTGSSIRLPFETKPYDGYPLDMTSAIAGDAMHDVGLFSTMWIFGGSDEWPRERIMAQVDSTIENIYKLKGWEPW